MIAHKSFRLSDDDRDLLKSLAAHYGISQTDVMRMAIRNEARGAGIVREVTKPVMLHKTAVEIVR